MKTAFLTYTAILSVVGLIMADNCTPGLNYCGHSLLAKGDYRAQLDELYQDDLGIAVSSGDGDLWIQDLFTCVGGRSGVVTRIETCVSGICFDNGDGTSDKCAPPKRPEDSGEYDFGTGTPLVKPEIEQTPLTF